MVTITRQQAICMFYCEKYTQENVAKLSERIEEMEDVDICSLNDPTSPLLQCQKRIHQNPFLYNMYPVGEAKNDDKSVHSGIMLRKLATKVETLLRVFLIFFMLY